MNEVGAGWAMTKLAPSPITVSLVQAATTLPMFLLSLPAGAFADVVNRRRLMIGMQIAMLIIATLLTLAAWQGVLTAGGLLAATLGLGIGAAMVNPAWQTAMTDLVSRDELPAASALNSVSLNLSRAIGPALGGLLVARWGPTAAMGLNAVSFAGIIAALFLWKYEPPKQAAPAERFIGALKTGIRYIRHAPRMRAQLVRTASFSVFASCLWALMPLIANRHLGLGAWGYGSLLACLGAGAVGGTLIFPRVRSLLPTPGIVIAASLLFAGAMTAISLLPSVWVAFPSMVCAGIAWVTMVVCLNVAAQAGTPPWVRARALACYFTIFFGGMALGSTMWGIVAARQGIPAALCIASGGLAVGLATMGRYRLDFATQEETEISSHWEDPIVRREIGADDGPVVITVEYTVRDEDATAFCEAMAPVAQTRYRDGAFSWTLSRCTENPQRWLEVFMVESWAEHLRQHTRVTMADKKIQARATAFHAGEGRPKVSHFVSVDVQVGHAPSAAAGQS